MDEEQKKKKKKKPGQWSVGDIFIWVFGLAAMIALAVAGFKAAKWAVATYM